MNGGWLIVDGLKLAEGVDVKSKEWIVEGLGGFAGGAGGGDDEFAGILGVGGGAAVGSGGGEGFAACHHEAQVVKNLPDTISRQQIDLSSLSIS